MTIPNLKNMHPTDRAELQAWCADVVRRFNALELGKYQPISGRQVIQALDATVPSGLTTKRQLDSAVDNVNVSIDSLIANAVNKLKQDNNLV